MRIAIATCRALPDLTPGDRLVADELRARGADVRPAIWDDDGIAWDAFDVVVVRLIWDYHLAPARFAAWLDRLEAAARPVINPLEAIRWNSHKRYLFDLEQRGCRIPRTRLEPRGGAGSLAAHLAASGWTRAVIKPAISASAYRTRRVEAPLTPADEQAFAEIVAAGDAIVQEYLDEVTGAGEWSLVFVGGRFSHAVIKRAAAGDFRVQREFGGAAELAPPPASVDAAARAALDAVPWPLPFARIDLVETPRGVLLMEAELIEPHLFVEEHPPAAAAFADAVMGVLAGSERPGLQRPTNTRSTAPR